MPNGNGQRFTHKKQEIFLEALADTCNVSAAAEACGVTRRCAYYHRESDEEFAKAWDKAKAVGAAVLEDEAVRRATGWEEKVFDKDGREVGTRVNYSDTLLIFMLKGAMPHKYRDRVEHTGEGGGPMQVVISRQGDEE